MTVNTSYMPYDLFSFTVQGGVFHVLTSEIRPKVQSAESGKTANTVININKEHIAGQQIIQAMRKILEFRLLGQNSI